MFSDGAAAAEKSHPLAEAESTNGFERDQANPRGSIHPRLRSTAAGYNLPLGIPIRQAAAVQPREGVLSTHPLSRHRPLSKDTRAEAPVPRPSVALCLFLFIRRMNEMFHTPAQLGVHARETLTGSKTNCVQHLGTGRGGQEEVADGELGGFK